MLIYINSILRILTINYNYKQGNDIPYVQFYVAQSGSAI
jgi:hypothetical protein